MHLTRRFLDRGLPAVLLASVWLTAGWSTASAQMPAGARPKQTLLPPTSPPNQVSIAVRVPRAYASAGIPGSFVLTRADNALEAVTVNYAVSGKAVAGVDYQALKGTRVIPAGKIKVRITIHPLVAADSVGQVRGVRVTLLTGEGYAVTAQMKATVKIVQ